MNLFAHPMRFLKSSYTFCFALLIVCNSCNQAEDSTSHYSVKASINTEQQSVKVDVDITYLPSKATKSIEFITHENVIIQSCTANGLLDYTEKGKANKAKVVTLHFEKEIATPLTIRFDYAFVLKEEDAPWGIDKISEDWIELSLNSGWLPIIATYSNQFTSETELEIVSKNEFSILSSGTSRVVGSNKFNITNTTPQMDLVLIGSSQFQESRKGHISIFENQENKERNEFIFSFSEKSYQWLNDTFGEVKKMPPVKLVITPREESGYARKNFIVLSNDISVQDTLHFVNYITHEFAHFWSTGANPISEHRWLDESIAEYIAWKYVEKNYSEAKRNEFLAKAKKEAGTIAPVYIIGVSKVPSHAVMYRKGVYKLFKLEEMIGEEEMFSLLSGWFKVENKNSESFLEHLKTIAGVQTADKFRLELSK